MIEYLCASMALEYLCDWKKLIVILALVGAVLNAAGRWQGFLFWLATNGYWCQYNFRAGEYEQAVIFAAFELLCLWGIWQWSLKGTESGEIHAAMSRLDKERNELHELIERLKPLPEGKFEDYRQTMRRIAQSYGGCDER